ncbi:carbohydrate ABC transporter permease [Paenibacillus crassostreae]|uniref:Sugar ABC transporter ATP-binding protein n=1 Tax=Paenibacillus crassostreae TaxID=1763538 RepID=A0A167DNW3_9BACL|nr:carbohydrate ABC transporter permease [Paenibacillus crassostreae]AOZ91234.1 sugar ABC transporter ATP-binding protein [Paenibacillus crassostreae]OAB74607.1 sugar ABC transporter ATP-binding protein [Paenibacillus crassostreae]
MNKNRMFGRISAYVFLICGSIFMLLPFAWMISTSLKQEGKVFEYPVRWIPNPVEWGNYLTVLTEAPLIGGLMNTLIIILPPMFIGLLTSALAAYAFAKLRFPGRDFLFMMMLATMTIPGVVTMIPTFILFKTIGWLDSWNPLMIPGMFGSAACVFFLRQYFRTIPSELEDAAKMDGLNPFGVFVRVILPLSKPALAAQAIFGFIGGYNDFMGPLIYINSPEKFTLQLVLASFQGYYVSNWTLIMAGSVLALIPTVILFFFAQRYFVEGITMSGMKG